MDFNIIRELFRVAFNNCLQNRPKLRDIVTSSPVIIVTKSHVHKILSVEDVPVLEMYSTSALLVLGVKGTISVHFEGVWNMLYGLARINISFLMMGPGILYPSLRHLLKQNKCCNLSTNLRNTMLSSLRIVLIGYFPGITRQQEQLDYSRRFFSLLHLVQF